MLDLERRRALVAAIRTEPLVSEILKAFPGACVKMIDANEIENEAIEAASAAAGEYLEELHRTDLAYFSEEQWLNFITVIINAYEAYLQEQKVPF